MKRNILAALAALAAVFFISVTASAQVKQSGTVTQRHTACWVTTGVIGDCGTAALPFASSFGTLGQGPTICANSADPATAAGYNRLCIGASTAANAQISLQNFGTAAAQSIDFNINGNIISFPSTAPGTFITGTGPFTVAHIPCFSNTSGNLIDCGLTASAGVITGGTWSGTAIAIAKGGTGATTASGARTNLGLGSIAVQDADAVTITGGTITGMPTPSASTDVANKNYVDSLASGLHPLPSSTLATTTVLPRTPVYSNGTAGVGATLVAGTNGALSVDGISVNISDIIIVKNQTSTTGCTIANIGCQNGIYTVSATGDGANPYFLVRVTYFDTAAEMLAGSVSLVTSGGTLSNTQWVLASTVTTVGTTPVTFYQFGAAPPLTNASTMSNLRALPPAAATEIYLTGFYALGDGGEGAFVWSGASTATDDNGVVIQPNAGGTGRWIRATYSSRPNVRWWGAVCDYSGGSGTDDKTPFQAAEAWVGANGPAVIMVPRKAKCALANEVAVTHPGVTYAAEGYPGLRSPGGNSAANCGASIYWTGASGGTMFSFVPPGPLHMQGGGMDGLCLFGRNIAGRGIKALSVWAGVWQNLYLQSFTLRSMDMGVTGVVTTDPCDMQKNLIQNVYINNLEPGEEAAGHGFFAYGSPTSACNFSFNTIANLTSLTFTGNAIVLAGTDNNRWYGINALANNTTYSVDITFSPVSEGTPRVATSTESFFGLSANVVARGTETVAALFTYGNTIWGLDKGNSVADPVIGTGAQLTWYNTSGEIYPLVTSKQYFGTLSGTGNIISSTDGNTGQAFKLKQDSVTSPRKYDFIVNSGSGDVTAISANAGGVLFPAIASTAQTYALCYNNSSGNVTYQAASTGCASSSIRFKDGIVPFTSARALDIALGLKPIRFHYRPEADMGDEEHIGLSAENVAAVEPLLAGYEPDGVTPRAVKTQELPAVAIGAIKALNERIEMLQSCQKSVWCRLFGQSSKLSYNR